MADLAILRDGVKKARPTLNKVQFQLMPKERYNEKLLLKFFCLIGYQKKFQL